MRSEKFSHVEYENGHLHQLMALFFNFILLLGLATEYSTAMVVRLHSTVQYPACLWLLHAVCPWLVVPSFSIRVQYSTAHWDSLSSSVGLLRSGRAMRGDGIQILCRISDKIWTRGLHA